MYKAYKSKPITRYAFQISEEMVILYSGKIKTASVKVGNDWINFDYTKEINPGDWVIYNGADDSYHCTDEVFRERNIV